MNLSVLVTVVLCVASFTIANAQPRRPAPIKDQETAGRSIIRGRVIYADTGRPLRRAEVSLVDQDTDKWAGSALSDRSGEFEFRDVGAGKYFVVVSAPDIVSPMLQLGRKRSLRLKIALGQIEDGFSEVSVDGRSSAKTEIRASRGGVITGRVLTDSDEPIAKAIINIIKIEKDGARASPLTEHAFAGDKWRFKTDSRGIYRIAGLATGDYIVRATESDEGGDPNEAAEGSYTDGTLMTAFYPKAFRVQDATSVAVQQGLETTDIDIRLPDRMGHRVSGTVLIGGRPAHAATITLIRDDDELDEYRRASNQTSTKPKGYWEIHGVPDGNYTLLVSGMGGRTLVGGGLVPVAPLRRPLIVAGGDVPNLKIELAEAGTVAGLISVESGTQKREELTVELVSPAQNTADGEETEPIATTYVREDGTFSVAGIPPGSFHIRLSGLGAGVYIKSITLNGKDSLRNPLKTVEGKVVDGVRIVLSSDLVTLAGRAVEKNDRSKPLTNATVLLFPVEVERRRVSEGPIAVRTDKAGRFVVKGAPGEYFVFVFDRGRKGPVVMPSEAKLIKNSSTLQKITLQRGEEKPVEVVGP